MSAVPVFLVKRNLENVLLNEFEDAKHWALKVRNKYYHLGVKNGKESNGSLYLDTTDFSKDLVSWSMLGEHRTEHYVGKTSMSHSEIKQAGNEVLSEWESMNCKYTLLEWNCKRFVGHLRDKISPTLPDWGMKMKTIEIPLALLEPRVIRFIEKKEKFTMSPRSIDKLTTLFRVIWQGLLNHEAGKSGRPFGDYFIAPTPLEYFSPDNLNKVARYSTRYSSIGRYLQQFS